MISFGSRNRTSLRALATCTLAVCALSALASPCARADAYILGQTIPKGDIGLTPFLGVGYYDYAELGFAASFLLVPHGFIPPINNSVHAEATIFQDIIGRSATGAIGGRMRWDFHLHPQWSVYAAPGFGVRYGDRNRSGDRYGDHDRDVGAEITGDIGGFFHLNETVSLRAEASAGSWYDHGGLRAGVTFRI